MKKYRMLFLTLLFAAAFSGCGGGGASVDIMATLKIIRLDGMKINLTDRPIPLRIILEATFSQAVNPSSIEEGTSVVDEGGSKVPGTFTWGSGNTVMTFTPAGALKYKTVYTVRIMNTAAAMVAKAEGSAEQTFTTMTKGDVNADGVPDIVIGAEGVNTNKGAAYVFSGSALSGTVSPTDALATISGQTDGGRLGNAVSLAGDINADGYEDVIIGARDAENKKGAVYIYSGAALSGPPLATITGNTDNDNLGHSVSAAGDVNNDGYDDVIIGAPNVNFRAGAVYIFGGSSLVGSKSASDALAAIGGQSAGDELGHAVSGIGDVNGDGSDDILIGAWQTPSGGTRGSAYVFSGAALSGTLTVTDAMAAINSNNDGDLFGSSVSGARDVNADGVPDIIIGAYGSNVAGPARGSVYLFSGASLSGTKTLGEALAAVNGQNDNDQLGFSVSGAGDVNADGYDDVIVGANQADAGGDMRGSVYVFSGATLAGPKTTADALAAINGAADFDNLGQGVSGAGDVNLDGYADVLVGSSAIGTDKGAAYLFHGASLAGIKQPANAIVTINGAADYDSFASSLSGVSY
jgi:hypothetical protein